MLLALQQCPNKAEVEIMFLIFILFQAIQYLYKWREISYIVGCVVIINKTTSAYIDYMVRSQNMQEV